MNGAVRGYESGRGAGLCRVGAPAARGGRGRTHVRRADREAGPEQRAQAGPRGRCAPRGMPRARQARGTGARRCTCARGPARCPARSDSARGGGEGGGRRKARRTEHSAMLRCAVRPPRSRRAPLGTAHARQPRRVRECEAPPGRKRSRPRRGSGAAVGPGASPRGLGSPPAIRPASAEAHAAICAASSSAPSPAASRPTASRILRSKPPRPHGQLGAQGGSPVQRQGAPLPLLLQIRPRAGQHRPPSLRAALAPAPDAAIVGSGLLEPSCFHFLRTKHFFGVPRAGGA
jgi:hypothetical protein